MFKLLFSIFNFVSSIYSSYSSDVPLPELDMYNRYIDTYEKSFNYNNFKIFQDNIRYINKHNQKNYSYKLGINQFIDLPQPNTLMDHFYGKSNGTYKVDNLLNPPESLDWRERGVITDVKNQGKCGSCWSFSATGSMEAIHAIKTGTLLNISEQNLMDCSNSYGNRGCHGGSMDNAFKYVIDNGICSEKSYPYTGVEGECMVCNPIINISDYKDIIPNNEEILKLIVHLQPVSVAIQANLRSFQLYSSGIYSDPSCGNNLDHGVLIVGYGSDVYNKMDYWIVKNSWGPNWGENGYIRIQRNIDQESGLCGIAMQPSIPVN